MQIYTQKYLYFRHAYNWYTEMRYMEAGKSYLWMIRRATNGFICAYINTLWYIMKSTYIRQFIYLLCLDRKWQITDKETQHSFFV